MISALCVLVCPIGASAQTTAQVVSSGANPTRYHLVTPFTTLRLSAGGKGLAANQPATVRPLRDDQGVTRIGATAATHVAVEITASGSNQPGEVWIHRCGLVPDAVTDIAIVLDELDGSELRAAHALVPLTNRAFCITSETPTDLSVTVHGYVTDDAVGIAFTDISDVVLADGALPVPLSGGSIPAAASAVAVMVEGRNAGAESATLSVAACANPAAPTVKLLTIAADDYVAATLPLVRVAAGQCLVSSQPFSGRVTLLGVYSSPGVSSLTMPPNMRFDRHAAPRFVSQQPARVLDTRKVGGSIASQAQRELDLSTQVPFSATAVVLNMTSVSPTTAGYLTVFPCDTPRPEASSLNYIPGQTVANSVTVAMRASRKICIFAAGSTDVIADLSGWYTNDGSGDGLMSTAPSRVLDTRTGAVPAAASITRVALRGVVPGDATTAVVNLTAVGPAADGYVTAYPCDQPLPDTSSLNYATGQTVPNYVTVKLAADQSVCLFSSAPAHLLADLLGWYSPSSRVGFIEMVPMRAFDSRKDQPGKVRANGVMWLTFDSQPAAWLINLTAVGPDSDGYATAYPCETSPLTSPPNASNLNYVAGQVVPNQVLVAPGSTRSVCFFSKAATHLLADLAGSFTAQSTYTPALRPA